MGRSVRSCSVVRPGPVPRETHPRNLRPGAVELDCARRTPLCASATPPASTPRRDTVASLGFIQTSVSPRQEYGRPKTRYWNLLVLSGDLGQRTYWYIISSGNITMSNPLGYDPGRNFYVWRAS